MHLFNPGDTVVINKDGCLDSEDKEFLLSLLNKEMKISHAKEIDADLWHYTCVLNGSTVLGMENKPFPFIDSDLSQT